MSDSTLLHTRGCNDCNLRDVDVRVIAITNRNLAQDVEASRFREDLYYRLNVLRIHLPALRERLEDIPTLAEHFLGRACRQLKKEIDGFAPNVIEMFQSYPWPGNIRELENEISRAATLVEEGLRLQTYHFSPQLTRGESLIQEVLAGGSGYTETMDRFQRRFIEQVLRECGGNRPRSRQTPANGSRQPVAVDSADGDFWVRIGREA